jgi:hypothetical protein
MSTPSDTPAGPPVLRRKKAAAKPKPAHTIAEPTIIIQRSVLVLSRVLILPTEDPDTSILITQEVYEYDEERLRDGSILVQIFGSELITNSVDGFLTRHRAEIFQALPEEASHHPGDVWGERRYLTFLLAYRARVYTIKQVLEYLAEDNEYEFRFSVLPVLPLRHSPGAGPPTKPEPATHPLDGLPMVPGGDPLPQSLDDMEPMVREAYLAYQARLAGAP